MCVVWCSDCVRATRRTRFPPTFLPQVSGVSEGPQLGRRAITSRHLPELLPLLLGSGKVGKKGDRQGGPWRAEVDRGGYRRRHGCRATTEGGTDAGSPWGPVGAAGLKARRRSPGFRRRGGGGAWERRGLTSPYLACAGAFCGGAGARWVPHSLGADPAVLSLRGQPAPAAEPGVDKLARSGARRGGAGHARRTAHGRRDTARSAALFRFVVFHWSPRACLRVSRRPPAMGRFTRVPGAPRVCVPLSSRRRVEKLPWSSWRGCAVRSYRAAPAHGFPPPTFSPSPPLRGTPIRSCLG